jgi:hypothetical protein
MENLSERQKEALKLVEAIIKVEPDHGTMAYALKMRERLKLPMSVVLAKLWPELTVQQKVEKLDVTRQAYYLWINGLSRPTDKLAKRIAAQTGFDWKDIRAKPER